MARGALLQCSSLLVSLGDAVAEGNKDEGMELVGKLIREIHLSLGLWAFLFSLTLKKTSALVTVHHFSNQTLKFYTD